MYIRSASKADLETVKNITYETIQAIYPHYYPKGAVDFFIDHHNEENILEDISLGRVLLLEEQVAVGTVTIKENEICRLFILPKEQGKGYGSLLLDYAEEQIGRRFVTVRLDASFSAKALYLRRGYKIIASPTILTISGDYLCYDIMEKSSYIPKAKISDTKINYEGRTFIPQSNTENGEVDGKTIFTYHQNEDVLWAEYTGGDIVRGYIVGRVSTLGILDFYYQHLNRQGEIRIGKCHSTPHVLEDGRIALHEEWQWLNGDQSKGASVMIETENHKGLK